MTEPLTDAQVRAGALPGESWAAARQRLEAARGVCSVDGLEACQAGFWLAVPVDDGQGLDDVPAEDGPDEATESFYRTTPLTVARVAALALPGDDWPTARDRAYRLHRCVTPCEPCPVCNHDGAQRWGGWIDVPGYGCGACAAAEAHTRKLPHSF